MLDGVDVGLLDGDAVGLLVGLLVGNFVGAFVGKKVGAIVGSKLGWEDEDKLGLLLGSGERWLGFNDGSDDGCTDLEGDNVVATGAVVG